MGPCLIFDKSTLQMLSIDESVWLDNFFLCNITPIFFVESLSGLEKHVKKGKSSEDYVGELAKKTPEHGCVNCDHYKILWGELSGKGKVEMDGRPTIPGGKGTVLAGEMGIIYDMSQEEEAFHRWQKGDFFSLERDIAKKWRNAIKGGDFDSRSGAEFSRFFNGKTKPETLTELLVFVDELMQESDPENLLRLGLNLIGVKPENHPGIIERFRQDGAPSIKGVFPYFFYCLRLELFFSLGKSISIFNCFPNGKTHRIDFAYLYYLPFCTIFSSNDKFHSAIVPLFMKQDQEFILGTELKKDLKKIDDHYSSLPNEVKDRGILSFAAIPPEDTEFWTTRMWDKYMSKDWRNFPGRKFDGTDKIDAATEEALVEKIQKFMNSEKRVDASDIVSSGEDFSLGRRKFVSGVRGKWKKLPDHILNSNKRVVND